MRRALSRLVGHREHLVDLRVEHLVHGDEVGAGHIPMRMLEHKRCFLLLAQTLLENADDLLRSHLVEAWNNE